MGHAHGARTGASGLRGAHGFNEQPLARTAPRAVTSRQQRPPSVHSEIHASLDRFPLRWRFTAARLGAPAAGIVGRLKPLDPSASAELAARVARVTHEEPGSRLTFRSDEAPGMVRANLAALPIDAETAVVLSWSPSTALQTDWEVFVAHWDDFCYPASDEVTIQPAHGRWMLRYHRYEVFQFSADPGITETLTEGVDGA